MSYRYYAFISYSSKDRAWAKWLHQRLETYRVPHSLVGRPGLDGPIPARLFPIFRDRDELPLSADLGTTITDALNASACLVVLCSRSAAQSRWVNMEISTFKAQGKADRIFALILDGEPNASDQPGMEHLECFPPALRYVMGPNGTFTTERCEPIGGDLRLSGDGRERAFQKTVAGLLGIGLNAIANRELARKRTRNVLLFLTFLVLFLGGLALWDYNRTKETYYRHFVNVYGVPTPTDPIDAETCDHLASFYRFESSQNKVRKVFHQNSSGFVIDDVNNFGASEEDVFYREDGTPDYVVLRNHAGRIVAKQILGHRDTDSNSEIVDYKNAVDQPLAISTYNHSSEGEQKGSITALRLEFNEKGRNKRKTYLNNYHLPVSDKLNTWSITNVYNKDGQVLQIVNCGRNGAPSPNQNGIQTVEDTPNEFGDETDFRFLDGNDKLTLSNYGYAIGKWKYDRWGNSIEESYYDENDKPTLYNGFFRLEIKRDSKGNSIEEDYFGTDNKPILRDGFATLKQVVDERGLVVEISYKGLDGKPVLNEQRYAKVTYKYDAVGNNTEDHYFDLKGNPTFSSMGWATFIAQFDSNGNLTREDHYDPAGKLVLVRGIASLTAEYTERNELLSESFFGIDGKPSTRDGYFKHVETYDERGNDIQSDFFGTDGKPTLREGGYSRRTAKYDSQGNLLEIAYFGVSGEPVNSNIGVWKTTGDYDSFGNRVLEQYYNKDGQLTHPFGFSKARYTYDSIGQQTGILYLDDHDKPVVSKEGWVSKETKYDNRGYATEESYFDLKHHLVSPIGKTARKVVVLDERGNNIEVSFYGPDNKLMLNPEVNNVARVRDEYDLTGRLTASAYFGTDDKPIIGTAGYASSKIGYDERGDIILWEFFGLKGEPVLLQDGYHKVVFLYDDRDRQVDALFYGLDGKPIVSKSAGADKKFIYDARGNLTQVEFLGIDGQPMNVNGCSKFVIQYSPSDERTEIDKYSKDGRLVGKEH